MQTPYFSKVRIRGHRVKNFLIVNHARGNDELCIGGKTFKVIIHSGTRYNEIEVLPVGIDTLEGISQWCIELAKLAKIHEDKTGNNVWVEMVVLYS